MAIQKLEIHGYRSFREVVWEPGKLNLLVGPNGAGKSNLLRLLELISEVAKGKLAQAINDGGGIVPLLWNQQAPAIGWRVRIDPVDPGRDPVQDALTCEFELEHQRRTSSYRIAKDSLGNWVRFEQGLEESPYWIYARDAHGAMIYDQKAGKFRFDDLEPNESLLAQISYPTNLIPGLTKRHLEDWRIYHDVRVERGSPMRSPATTQYVKSVAPDGRNLAQVLHTLYTGNRSFRQQIDEGMRAGFGAEYERLEFPPAASQQIQLAIQWKSSIEPHTAQMLSDGTLRFLLLLTVLSNPEPPALIAIDEPEVGLHPSMLPIIAEYADEASDRTQVILTSHSPEFLDVFTRMEPSVTLFQWEEGQTELYPLPSELLARWLERYRLGEMFTSGDLEAIAAPPVEQIPGLDERLAKLPPVEDVIAAVLAESEKNGHG